jgi:HEAT repeat protein
MTSFQVRLLAAAALGAMGMSLAGCAELDSSTNLAAALLGRHVSDEVPGVVSPAERMATLRKMGREAASAGPAARERISVELAAAFQVEADPLVRMEIVRAVSEVSTPAAASALAKALADPDPDVRVAACRAWGERGGADAVTKLSETLKSDVDMDVRLAAVRALGETGEPVAVTALGEALEDRDPAMQYQAVDALREVTGEEFGDDVGRWRQYVQYVKGKSPTPPEPLSIAERIRRVF